MWISSSSIHRLAALSAATINFNFIFSNANSFDEAILADLLESYTSFTTSEHAACVDAGGVAAGKTSFSFEWADASFDSEWYPPFAAYEQSVFQAEMTHTDLSGNDSWTMRVSTGGNIYSLVFPDRHGETMPPQNHPTDSVGGTDAAPFIDEVNQNVAVRGPLNQGSSYKNRPEFCENGGTTNCKAFYVHQAGAYQVDSPSTDNNPFFSPSLAAQCSGNSCVFASWGTQAHVPTPFTSAIIFINKYTNCDNGIIEHTQMIHNFADPTSALGTDDNVGHTYFNIPWSGIRASNLPHALEPKQDGTFSYSDPNNVDWMYLCPWGQSNPLYNDTQHDGPSPVGAYSYRGQMVDIDYSPGYTSFAEDRLLVHNTPQTVEMPCRKDTDPDCSTCMVNQCTDTQVNQGYTRLQLKVQPNSSPNCQQHGTGVWNDNLVKMQCQFKDLGFGPMPVSLQGKNVVGNGCSLWSDLAFYNTRTKKHMRIAWIYHWSWKATDRWVRFVPYYLDATEAASDLNSMFDNTCEAGASAEDPCRDELLIDVRLTSNVDAAYIPTSYSSDVDTFNAFTFVYGKGDEYDGSLVPGSSRRRMGSTKVGRHRRDYHVFTVNWRGATLGAGETYVNRGYYFASDLSDVKARGDYLATKVNIDKVALEDWTSRDVDIYKSSDGTHFAISAASSIGASGTSCSDATATLACQGKSVPAAGHTAYFLVTCVSDEYVGPDPYHFTPDFGNSFPGHGSYSQLVRSYICDGQTGVRPTWKLLGFFVNDGACATALTGATYDEAAFSCNGGAAPTASPSKAPTASPTKKPTDSPTEGPTTAKPTASPSKAPTASPTKKPTDSPTEGPTTAKPTASPSKAPTASPATPAPTNNPTTSAPTKDTPNPTSPPTSAPSLAPGFEVRVRGRTRFSNTNASSQTDQQIDFFREEFRKEIEDESCTGLDARSCRAVLTSRNRKLRRHSRQLQGDLEDLIIEYEIVIEAICNSGCTNAQAVGNALYNQVTGGLLDAINNGSLMTTLKGVSSDIDDLLEAANASGDFSEVVIPILGLLLFYPDWVGHTGTCKNDGGYPFYMYVMGGYFENSLAACCERYFNWDYFTCTGNYGTIPSGYYPNWGSSESKCLESSQDMPDYIRSNPEQWLHDDIESCCDNYYNWEMDACIVSSGGDPVATATGRWYVNHQDEICQQDCSEDDGGQCGGLANDWDELYDTVADCCDNQLSWVNSAVCEGQSNLITVVGTSQWYVDWGLENCVKDCDDSSDANCGGFAQKWEELYANSSKCCERLWWMPKNKCVS